MNIDIVPNGAIKRVHVSQNDVGRTLTFELFNNSAHYNIPSGAVVKIQGTKSNGLGFSEECTVNNNLVTVDTTEAMTEVSGNIPTELSIQYDGVVIGTSNFVLAVERNPHPDGTVDGTGDNPVIERLEVIITNAVDAWLDEHPEATTTVVDGSLTEEKFSEALKLKTINDYVTPQMYGAVGDGVADDTDAFIDAIDYCNENSCFLYIKNGDYNLTRVIDTEINFPIIADSNVNYVGVGYLEAFATNLNHKKGYNTFVAKPSYAQNVQRGVSAISAEVVPDEDFTANAVGVYGSGYGKANGNYNVWGANFIVHAEEDFNKYAVGIEVDVDNYSEYSGAGQIATGINVTGIGTENPNYAYQFERADSTAWRTGIHGADALQGIELDSMQNTGMYVHDTVSGNGIFSSSNSGHGYVANTNGGYGFYANNNTGSNFYSNTGSIGFEASGNNTIGLSLNNTGILFGNNSNTGSGLLKGFKRMTLNVPSVTVPAQSVAEATVETSVGSGDDAVIFMPVTTPGNNLTWSVRKLATQIRVRYSNPTTSPITTNAISGIFVIFSPNAL